jgi:hypothetical protein
MLFFEKKMVYLASNDVFIAAVSISKYNTGAIFQEPHLQTVVYSCFVVWLVVRPRQVVWEWNSVHSRAPSPLAFASFLRTTRPVVEIVAPTIYNLLAKISILCPVYEKTNFG